MILHVLSLDEWKTVSKKAHELCFTDEHNPDELTCSYALMVTNEKDVIVGYATILEINTKTAYMQHGGGMPILRGTVLIMSAYKLILDFLMKKYYRITTRVQNNNIRMLKLAMSQGLLISGIDNIENEIFLHLTWNKGV